MTPLESELLDFLLPAPGSAWTALQAQDFLAQKGTRSATYLAVGMLLRNQQSDAPRAALVLEAVIGLQKREPGTWLGVWPGSSSSADRKRDHNWREFIGVGLIVARTRFEALLPRALVEKIEEALLVAAQGALQRNVGAEYTNIALMSAFLLEWAGARLHQPSLAAKGREKAQQVTALFTLHKTFTEDNSPTYGGVDALGLALWRELSPSPESRKAATAFEADFWRDTAALYHAGLRNLCGPYTRAYGMDMTRYTAITGVAILLLTQDKKTAPTPTDWHNRSFEWAYAPMLIALGLHCPKEALARFRRFDAPRRLERRVPHGGKTYPVQCLLEKSWMLGATVGLTRSWEQHCPATLHWRLPDGSVGWLLVHGTNGATAKIEGRTLQVFLSQRHGERFRLLVNAPDRETRLEGSVWSLGGLTVNVQTPLEGKRTQVVDDPRFGRALELSWSLPASLPDQAILALQVQ